MTKAYGRRIIRQRIFGRRIPKSLCQEIFLVAYASIGMDSIQYPNAIQTSMRTLRASERLNTGSSRPGRWGGIKPKRCAKNWRDEY